MKRIAAILLLGVFSFNLFGYQFIASFHETKENAKIESALVSNNYSDEQLISLKQPADLPYYNNSSAFQRIDGEVEIGGVLYTYVKCRIYNDSLEFLCIPNTGKMKIREAKDNFSKLASDFQQSNNTKKKAADNKSFQKTLSEYEAFNTAESTQQSASIISTFSLKNSHFVNDLFLKTAEQPPDAFSVIS